MNTLTITAKQLQRGISKFLDIAEEDKIQQVIRHSRIVAVVISPQRYQNLVEAAKKSLADLST